MDQVSLCNTALGQLGEALIASLDDESAEAELCKVNLPVAIQVALEARPWMFATEWVEIPADVAPPANPGFPARFELPPTAIKVHRVTDGAGCPLAWVRERRFVLAEGPSALACVTFLVEDPGEWSPGFVLAVAYLLASMLAIPLTENRARHVDMLQLYQAQLKDAGVRDGQQGTPEIRRTETHKAWRR